MDTVMKYTINPFAAIGRKISFFLTVCSYSRAASELARQGYQAEAKSLMLDLAEFKNNN